MKKTVLLALVALLAGCASTGPVRQIADSSPLAILTVSANPEITWVNEESSSGGLLKAAAGKLINDAKSDTASTLLSRTDLLVGRAEKLLRATIAGAGFTVVDPAKIMQSGMYLSAKEDRMMAASGQVAPYGYRFISDRDTVLVQKLAAENAFRAGLHVSFMFNKNMSSGVAKNGTAVAQVIMNVIMIDTAGKISLRKSYQASSEEKIPVIGGAYDPTKLMALFPGVIDDVCGKFVADFTK